MVGCPANMAKSSRHRPATVPLPSCRCPVAVPIRPTILPQLSSQRAIALHIRRTNRHMHKHTHVRAYICVHIYIHIWSIYHHHHQQRPHQRQQHQQSPIRFGRLLGATRARRVLFWTWAHHFIFVDFRPGFEVIVVEVRVVTSTV